LSLLVSACTAGTQACSDVQCNPAPCCGGSCVTDADCCGGTVCSTDGRCIPESCVACGELGCLVDFAACRATCVAPERCGQACTSDSECGVGAHCFAFAAGDRRCVPNRFEAECARCGADECVFDGARCDVSCRPAADAGSPDGGVGSCLACCQPCQADADCCPGTYCGESAMGGLYCFPVECRTCTYGCTFTCPG